MPAASATETFTRTTPESTTRATRWSVTSERRTCSRGSMPTSVPAWSGPRCVPSERCSMISSAAEPHPRSLRCGTRAGHRPHRRSHRYRVDHDLLLSILPADPRSHGNLRFLTACALSPSSGRPTAGSGKMGQGTICDFASAAFSPPMADAPERPPGRGHPAYRRPPGWGHPVYRRPPGQGHPAYRRPPGRGHRSTGLRRGLGGAL